MATKRIDIPDIGEVTLTKRKGNSNIRLSYSHSGLIKVSLPYYVPFKTGIEFVKSKKNWLEKHRPDKPQILYDGDRIGKAHRLEFNRSHDASRSSVRLSGSRISVTVPVGLSFEEAEVQKVAQRGALKALKKEADRLLPQRLSQLAKENGFEYNSLTNKRLSSRWGSCSQLKDITLNIYLMQLPWELIDYVIIHELTHTEHLNHSPEFWNRFEQIIPGAKSLRKKLKTHKTAVTPTG